MRILFLLSLFIATSSYALASTTAYDIPPREERTFVLDAQPRGLHQESGMARIVSVTTLGGMWILVIACEPDSPTNCTGWIET